MHLRCWLVAVASSVVLACGGSPSRPSPPAPGPGPEENPAPAPVPAAPTRPTYDVEQLGIPRFITSNYIDLDAIGAVSRFRSSAGHSYVDNFETCRSMKHYFKPASNATAATIPVYSPVTGHVASIAAEWAGVQIAIQADDQPAFRVILFHVNPGIALSEGTPLRSGQRLGTHVGAQTASDVAVAVDTPDGFQLVSWFDAISDPVFDSYRLRGVTRRSQVVIGRAERDGDPLSCRGETFTTSGSLASWVSLK